MPIDNQTLDKAGIGDPFTKRVTELGDREASLSKRAEDVQGQQAQSASETARLTKERGEAVAPAREALATRAKDMPASKADEERMPDYQRPTMDPKEMHEAFGLIMGAAMLTGAVSRTPYYGAMEAMTGAMNGFMKADAHVVEESIKTFTTHANAIKDRNAQKRRELDDAWKKYSNDLSGLKTELELIAARYDDPIAAQAAKSKSLSEIQKTIDANMKSTDTAINRMFQVKSTAESAAARLQESKDKRSEAGGGVQFSEQDVKYWTEVLQKGGSLPPRLATTPAGKKLVAEVMQGVSRGGVSPEEMLSNQAEFGGEKSAQRTLGTRAANMGMAVNEATQFADLALEAAIKVPRVDFVPLNQLTEYVKKKRASPEQAAFVAANRSFINAYAAAVSRSGGKTVHDTMEAGEMLQTAQGHDAYKAVIVQLKKEMAAAAKSPDVVKGELRRGKPAGAVPHEPSDDVDALIKKYAP